jgi:hypothetical protein
MVYVEYEWVKPLFDETVAFSGNDTQWYQYLFQIKPILPFMDDSGLEVFSGKRELLFWTFCYC